MRPFGSLALVTGGSRGIGLGYAEALAAAGCDVAMVQFEDGEKGRAEAGRIAQATGRRIYSIDADVADSHSARAAVDRAADLLGGLEIVVSNAGICTFTPFMEIDDACWHRHAGVNFHGGFYVGQQAARRMIEAGKGGRIVFTTSVGAFRSTARQTHYCATKGALHLLAQGMALELGCHQITVNCIAPGWIHTDINDEASRTPAVRDPWLKANCPIGRLGSPADLKSALLFLTSAESGYVNGTTIAVDGGWNAQL